MGSFENASNFNKHYLLALDDTIATSTTEYEDNTLLIQNVLLIQLNRINKVIYLINALIILIPLVTNTYNNYMSNQSTLITNSSNFNEPIDRYC